MDRLTKYSKETTHENGVCCTHFGGMECFARNGDCSRGCTWEEAAWSRLAAYEDTGLEPESVEALKLSMMGKAISEIAEFNGLSIDRLRELAEANKDGRVAVLPVGTGGAMLDTSYPENPRLIKRLHFAVAYVSKGIVFHKPYNIFLENIAAGYISPLSKEAEKALEAMTDG
jgi:hypothetical protein|nr:MAG TPA: hypothetical protein [Caudoviricetes sp.]